MAFGSHLDLDRAPDPAAESGGPRPFLSREQILGMRALLLVYALTFAVVLATNLRPVGDAVFRLSAKYLAVRLALGLMGGLTLVTFCLLLGVGLHHFFRGHAGPRPARLWLWVMILLNVAGVAVYYLWIVEPEQRALLRGRQAA